MGIEKNKFPIIVPYHHWLNKGGNRDSTIGVRLA
jgi:hypothetical protein